MSYPYATINFQLNPTIGGPLDKRTVGTATTRPGVVTDGLIRYETDTKALYVYDTGEWYEIATTEGLGPSFIGLGYLYEIAEGATEDMGTMYFYNKYSPTFYPDQPPWPFIKHTAYTGVVQHIAQTKMLFSVNQEFVYDPPLEEGEDPETRTSVGAEFINYMGMENDLVTIYKPLKAGGGAEGGVLNADPFGVIVYTKFTAPGFETDGTNIDISVEGEITIESTTNININATSINMGIVNVLGLNFINVDNSTTAITTSALTAELFGKNTTDVVRNPIGQVANNTTVASLISTYGTLQKLLAALLDIGPKIVGPLVSSGFDLAVSMTYTFNGGATPLVKNTVQDVLIGSTLQDMRLTLAYNRGRWTPLPTNDSTLLPFGRATGVTFQEPFSSTFIDFTIPINVAQDNAQPFNITSDIFVLTEFKFPASITTYNISNRIEMAIAQGANATNEANVSYFKAAIPLQKPTNTVSFRTYAMVKLVIAGTTPQTIDNTITGDATAADGYSGLAPTSKVTVGTTQVVACNFDPNNTLSIPFYAPTKLELYTVFFGWVEQENTENSTIWTSTATSRTVNGLTVSYHDIKFTNKNRGKSDFRVTLSTTPS